MNRPGQPSLLTAAVLGSGAFLVLSVLLPPLFSAFLLGWLVLLYRGSLGLETTVARIGGSVYILSGGFVLITGNRPSTWSPDTEVVILGFGILCIGYLRITNQLQQLGGIIESKLPADLERTGSGSAFSAFGGATLFLFVVWRIKSTFMPSAILSVTFPLSFLLNLLSRQSETVLGELVSFLSLMSGMAGLLACAFLIDGYDAARNYYRARNESEETSSSGSDQRSYGSKSAGGTSLQQLQSLPHDDFLSFGFSIYNERGYEVVDVIEDSDGYTEAILNNGSQSYFLIAHRKYLYDDFEIGPYVTNIVQQTDYTGEIDHVVFMTDCAVPEETKRQYTNDHYFNVVDGMDLCQWMGRQKNRSATVQ